MHPQLETLLELQDMKTQRRELREMTKEREVEESVFQVSIEDALLQLDQKIEEMEGSLSPQIRSRYKRLADSRGRAIVPVIGGTCYGCFVSIPTALASRVDRNEDLAHCDNCGRFLYLVD
jgi:uncharacterized protein